ncbi:uncharacterized protein BT62DRAFT_971879 [Guyanagaster necrorhizus]|uniref:Uncharacterized protein n=1 Tax=Guyanagaster necrorhizus TaxID=856835 RepID=A0A9P8APU9_9AGAR|nr:uncharacterized protein BT62DRAFT_971879 [Guyanagaster necrorhizus MCA 3950]KAG7443718.1 hypothetical protein BT62DRAFT_971879 [Guyanagaster necrorhizus MCA 3950]
MSLPPTIKDISTHPKKGSVVDPVDKVARDADVDRKIKLYGTIQALRQSRLPTNKQLDLWINYAFEHPPVQTSTLSKDGQKLAGDIQEIIRTLRSMIHDKDGDELIQDWIWRTRDVDIPDVKAKDIRRVDKEKAKDDADTATRHVRTLVNLVLTNSEFRKLIKDFSVVGRDLAAKAIAPSAEELEGVDESAPGDHFVSNEEKVETRLPGVNGQPDIVDPEEVKRSINAKASTSAQEGTKVSGIIGKVKNGFSDAIPQQYKDRLTEKLSSGKKFLSEDYFPKERREQWIWRAKKVVVECQSHSDYQESLRWLLDYVEEYASHERDAVTDATKEAGGAMKNRQLQSSLTELRTILERFANGLSLDLIIDPFHALSDDAHRDPELRAWFREGAEWLRSVLLKPGYILEPQSVTDGRKWTDSGKVFYGSDGKYTEHFDRLFNGAGTWLNGIGDDPINRKFAGGWTQFMKDLLFAEDGGLTFKGDLWGDIRRTVIPMLVEKLGYVPIPRIEYTDDAVDLIIENLTLSGRNLFPTIASIEAHNYMSFSPYSAIQEGTEESRHEIKLTLAQIQADLRDVAIYFNKKAGIPKAKDSGVADIVLGGQGLTATVHLVSSPKSDATSAFTIKRVKVKVDSLKFSVRDSKHDFFYKAVKPFVMGVVKKQIQKVVGDAIRTGLEYVDGVLVNVRQEQEEGKKGKVDAIQEVFRKRMQETKSTSSRSTSHFKIVANQRDSMLASEGSPEGWVRRTAERENMVVSGEGWRSDAFDID